MPGTVAGMRLGWSGCGWVCGWPPGLVTGGAARPAGTIWPGIRGSSCSRRAAAVGLPSSAMARRAAFPQLTGLFLWWWQVLGSEACLRRRTGRHRGPPSSAVTRSATTESDGGNWLTYLRRKKYPLTRHYLRTASDNSRSARPVTYQLRRADQVDLAPGGLLQVPRSRSLVPASGHTLRIMVPSRRVRCRLPIVRDAWR